MNKIDVLIGTAWGDEAKAKFIDYLAPKYDVIVRFQGGANAGHTIVYDGMKIVLHTLPTGVIHRHITNILARNVLIDIDSINTELDSIKNSISDFDMNKLIVSRYCQLVLPTHKALDNVTASHVGTTNKGIGPTYADKHYRRGVNIKQYLADKSSIDKLMAIHDPEYAQKYDIDTFKVNIDKFLESVMICDEQNYIAYLLQDGKRILVEGAQGSLLDIDDNGYPFVTSSNTNIGGVLSSLGVNHNMIGDVYGVSKAYSTRVGNGDFPTEILDADLANFIQTQGNEFGSTTGRKRRVGWLDLPLLKRTIYRNGINKLIITKIDVLLGLEVMVGTHYYDLEYNASDFAFDNYRSIEYNDFGIWEYIHKDGKLNEKVQNFLHYIEEQTGVPVIFLSTSPDRKDVLVLEKSNI